jgi:hypothetical protein
MMKSGRAHSAVSPSAHGVLHSKLLVKMLDSFLQEMLGDLTITVDHASSFPTILPLKYPATVWFAGMISDFP